VLLLFEELPENVSLPPVVYESYFGDMRGIRIGSLHAVVPSQVFKFLLEKPKIYIGTVRDKDGVLVGGVLYTIENLDTNAIFEVL
jgi:hypothetical protein